MEYKFSYDYFFDKDGNGMFENRIDEAVKLLQDEGDYILLEDGIRCYNAEELRALLKDKN